MRKPIHTHFLNVDLDLYSRHQIEPLVKALGRKVIVLFKGRDRTRYCAHLELAMQTKGADPTIRQFCRLIRALPRAERALWDGASSRDFSIGVQAGDKPSSCDFAIDTETIK